MSEIKPVRCMTSSAFCGAEPWTSSKKYDATFLGLPIDLGTHGRRSAAGAPAALRNASRVFPIVNDKDHRNVGWFDYTIGRPILEGRTLADAGDLIVDRHCPGNSLNRLPAEICRLRENSSLVVILGGDHSLTYWTTQGFQKDSVLLYLDAHEDATDMLSEWPHSGNIISFLEHSANLSAILQYGLRGLVPNRRRQPAPLRRLCRTPEEWRECIAIYANRPMALSIDTDVLNPFVIGSVASPSPGGMGLTDLYNCVLEAIDAGARISLLELVEFTPGDNDGPLQAVALAKLLLRMVDACLSCR